MNRTFGAVLAPSPIRDYNFDICCGATSATELPDEFELDMDSFSDVKDQLWTNGCVSFAASLIGECEYYKRTGVKKQISTGYTYGHKECRNGYMGYGMYMRDTMKGLTKIGFIPNVLFDVVEDMPDIYTKVNDRTDLSEYGKDLCPKAFVSLKVHGYDHQNILSIKQAIYNYKSPVIISSSQYFGSAHSVVLYGWDKNNNFKFQNSWGKSYKNNGRYTIDLDNIYDAYLLIFDDLKLPFTDVLNDVWYYKSLKNATFSGLIKGTSSTTFDPDNAIKRCDVAVIISRALRKAEKSITSYLRTKKSQGYHTEFVGFNPDEPKYFSDIDSEKYYAEDVNYISSIGIINGYSDGTFKPENSISRSEAAAIMVRAYHYLLEKIDKGVAWVDLQSNFGYTMPLKNYVDVEKGSWYEFPVQNSTQLGLMNGDSETLFDPHSDITRAECAVILERLFGKIDNILNVCTVS